LAARTVKYDALLLLTAAIWGFAFVAQRAGMEHVGPFIFNGIRFALGALVLLPVIALRHRRSSPTATSTSGAPGVAAPTPRGHAWPARAGLIAGLILFAGATLQQSGLVFTTAGKAGFITGLYVVIVPVLGLFWRQRASLQGWIGAVIAVAGLYLLSVGARFTIDPGDALVLAGAFAWAAHVLVIAHFIAGVDSLQLAALQFGVCSILSLAASAFFEQTSLPGLRAAAVPLLYSGFLSVGIAYTLQVVAQRHARPTHAAIILSLEAVFGAIGGTWLLGESLSLRELTGCALMLAAVVVSQLGRRDAPEQGEAWMS